MTKPAILPTSKKDPTGIGALERKAGRDFKRKMRQIRDGYVALLGTVPVEPVVNRRYAFLLDATMLEQMFRRVDSLIDEILLGRGQVDNWFLEAYIGPAYQRGTAQAYSNLAQQSTIYKATHPQLANLLYSQPYRTRIAMVKARVFEEMKGLSGKVKSNMSRVLAEGIGRGLNPKVIAKQLTERANIEARRGMLIARTEIPMALRRARWDEKDDAAEQYGIQSKLMHISALSATTRPSHAARHAKLYTSEEVRDWYSEDANSINCLCATIEILVDDKGEPLVPSIIERAKKGRQ